MAKCTQKRKQKVASDVKKLLKLKRCESTNSGCNQVEVVTYIPTSNISNNRFDEKIKFKLKMRNNFEKFSFPEESKKCNKRRW